MGWHVTTDTQPEQQDIDNSDGDITLNNRDAINNHTMPSILEMVSLGEQNCWETSSTSRCNRLVVGRFL